MLLEILQDDKTERKNAIAAILYRLEFGRLGISDDGVRYLEKQYDLGELNNPDFFVKRLTAQGDIGIFDDEEILQYYFNIGDIASADQSPVTPEVMAFACDTLFYGSDMDTPDQNKKRMHYLQEFKENYFHFYDNTFMERSGIRFNNLSFPEQGEYLIYHKSTTEDQRETLFDFLQRYGENGLRTFLSIEHGGREMGEKILTIGEKYPQEVSDKIFAKYGELVDTANSVESYLENEFQEADVVTVRQTAENLLLRGKALLSTLADAENLQSEDILLKLERMKDEVFLYTASVKALRDTDEDFKLENLEKDHFEILSGPELTNKGEDVTQHMKDIYLVNYKGEQFTDAFREAIIESFEKNLSNPQSRFYVLKHQGEIVAFNCFTPQEDGSVYFSNFNVDPTYAHARLGEAMMEASLDEESKRTTIECAGVPDASITQTYLKRGFEKVGEADVGGVTLWRLKKE